MSVVETTLYISGSDDRQKNLFAGGVKNCSCRYLTRPFPSFLPSSFVRQQVSGWP